MSVAIDANVLLYSADSGSPFHGRAVEALERVVAGDGRLYIFWPVAVAFIRVSTHPQLFNEPLTLDEAFDRLRELFDHPNVVCPGEGDGFESVLRDVAVQANAHSKLIHDAHLVALMRQHDVRTIYTNDRDFHRFEGVDVIDPVSTGRDP